MSSSLTPGSVTNWLLDNHGHRTGAEVELLWQRFGLRLVRIARQHLQTVSDHSYDEEDLAHSTFNEFFVRALDGQYQNLTSRQELWRLLVTISCNKSRRMRKRANHLHVPKEILPNHGVRMHRERITDEKNAPDWLVAITEESEFLMRQLDQQDPSGVLTKIALMRLDGMSNAQIAQQLGCTRRTIAARLELIRACWNSHLEFQLN